MSPPGHRAQREEAESDQPERASRSSGSSAEEPAALGGARRAAARRTGADRRRRPSVGVPRGPALARRPAGSSASGTLAAGLLGLRRVSSVVGVEDLSRRPAPRRRRRTRPARSSPRRRSRGCGYGASATYQDWSAGRALGGPGLAGHRDREVAEHRVGGAARRLRGHVDPLEDRLRYCGSMSRWRCGAGSISCTTPPLGSSTSMPTWGRTTSPPLAIAA